MHIAHLLFRPLVPTSKLLVFINSQLSKLTVVTLISNETRVP